MKKLLSAAILIAALIAFASPSKAGITNSSGITAVSNATSLILSNLASHQVIITQGSSPVTGVSPSTAGFILTSNGINSNPSFQVNTGSPAITATVELENFGGL